MWAWLNETSAGQMVFSWFKVFLAAVLFVILTYITNGNSLADITAQDLDMWLSAGLAALLPVVINYINPRDSRYGKTDDTFI